MTTSGIVSYPVWVMRGFESLPRVELVRHPSCALAQNRPVVAARRITLGATLAQIVKLGELKDAGVLSEDEFTEQRNRILNG
ncbi:MAG: SHOCT domain-containing protein [Mycetocola sp.]